MSYELVYTSAPRGLKQSAGGYCTVAADGGLPRSLAMKLEMLSPYQFHYKLTDADVSNNPVNYSHTIVLSGGEMHSVLSRVAFCGTDYSGRINKIAHHFLLTDDEKLPVGPARMLKEMEKLNLLAKTWDKKPEALASRRLNELLAGVDAGEPQPAQAWAQLGNAGWAGELARAFRTNKKIPAYIIFEPGMDVLPLYEESLALLPPQERWHVCFSTYYTSLPPGADGHWRAVLAGTQAAKEASRYPQAVVIDITKPLPPAPENEFTQAALTGAVVYAAQSKQPAGGKAGAGSAAPSAIEEKIRKARERMREAEPIEIREYENARVKSLQYLPDERRKTPLALTIALGVIAASLLVTNAVTFRQISRMKGKLQRQEIQLADAATTPENGGKTEDETDSDVTETQNQQEVEEKDEQKHREDEEEPAEDNGNEEDSEQEMDEGQPPPPQKPIITLVKRDQPPTVNWAPEIMTEPRDDEYTWVFALSNIDKILHMPVELARDIRGWEPIDDKNDKYKYELNFADAGPHKAGELSITSEEIVFRADEENWQAFKERINLLVIEVAGNGQVYQCALSGKRPIQKTLTLGWDDEQEVVEPEKQEIPYPWSSNPIIIDNQGERRLLELERGMRFATIFKQEDKIVVRIQSDFIDEIKKKTSEANRLKRDIGEKRKALSTIKTELESLKDKSPEAEAKKNQKTNLEGEVEKFDKQLQGINNQVKQWAEQIDKFNPIIVKDPWGVLAEFHIDFKQTQFTTDGEE